MAEQIRVCQAECRSTYGYRRVHIWLERKGVHCNPKTVLRVMKKYNLLSVVRRKRYVKYGEALHRYPNLLNRNFTAEHPNQKWVTDISYIRTGQVLSILSHKKSPTHRGGGFSHRLCWPAQVCVGDALGGFGVGLLDDVGVDIRGGGHGGVAEAF